MTERKKEKKLRKLDISWPTLSVCIYGDKWLRMSISTKVNIFLYGDAKLNLHSNMELFKAIHNYISLTNRFDP